MRSAFCRGVQRRGLRFPVPLDKGNEGSGNEIDGLRKIRNFQPFLIMIMHLRCCVDESDLLVVLALATSQLRTEPGSYFNRCVAFIGNEQNDESVTGN